MPPISELKVTLKATLAEDLKKGLDAIDEVLPPDSHKYNELVHQLSRFNSNNNSIHQGTISGDDANRVKAQISQALLHLIDSLKASDLKSQDEEGLAQHKEERAGAEQEATVKEDKNSTVQGIKDRQVSIKTGKTTHQNAEKIYNIDKIDNANFS